MTKDSSLIIGITVGIGITLLFIFILKQMNKGSIVELKRDNNGNITEILERVI